MLQLAAGRAFSRLLTLLSLTKCHTSAHKSHTEFSKKNCSDNFYRATLCVSAVLAVARCPSVCLSVTLVHCIHTTEDIVRLHCRSGSRGGREGPIWLYLICEQDVWRSFLFMRCVYLHICKQLLTFAAQVLLTCFVNWKISEKKTVICPLNTWHLYRPALLQWMLWSVYR